LFGSCLHGCDLQVRNDFVSLVYEQ
jgi:hypothetical protein